MFQKLEEPMDADQFTVDTGQLLDLSNQSNFTEPVEDGLHAFTTPELVIWFLVYGVVAFLAVFGNSLVVFIVFSRPRMQTVTNYFIVNLAVADAMTGMLAIPFKFQAALLQRWDLPNIMCGLVPFIETVSLSVSVFTLTLTAVDRLRAILFPTVKMKRWLAKTIILVIWIVSIVFSAPYGIDHQVHWIEEMKRFVCFPKHGEEAWWKIYNVYLTIVQYYVPLFIINGAYCFIGYKVWLTKPVIDHADPNRDAFERNKKRVIKMLVIVVALFTFCWLPYETYLVLCEVRPNVNNYYYINVIFFCCHWLAMSNSCLNPIIYGVYNEKFQKEYKRLFRKCFRVKGFQQVPMQPDDIPPGAMITTSEMLQKRLLVRQNSGEDSELYSNCRTKATNLNAREKSCHYYIASELGRDEDNDEGNSS